MASIVAASQFWLTGRGSFLATRCLLAFWHGGFIPDTILYLSYWYTKFELPIRLGFFWVILTVTALVSSFLAVGLLEMRGVAGKAGWWVVLVSRAEPKADCHFFDVKAMAFPHRRIDLSGHLVNRVLHDATISEPDQVQIPAKRMVYRPRGQDHHQQE